MPVVGGIGVLAFSGFLRGLPFSPDPILFGQLQFTSGIVAITFAGAAFVRFRGTRDRLPLILAAGFVMVGVTLASSSLSLPSLSPVSSTDSLRDPMTWVIGRTLLAIVLLCALLAQKEGAWSRNPRSEIIRALALAVLASIFLSFMHRHLPLDLVVQPGRFFPRPGNLIPAACFLLAAFFYHRRLANTPTAFDVSLYLAVAINFWSSLAAAQSDRRLDATFALAATLQFLSFAGILAGAFLDNLHLFQDVQRFAVTDPVTGLANFRQLTDSLELEIQRTDRSGRPFALLLFDLDGLKEINDKYGHQEGTRALRRAGEVIRMQSRGIDTAARHGGDEFALVLPETTIQGAREALNRICDHVSADGQEPRISVSGGFAICPRDGVTADTLMEAADRELYRMKKHHKRSAPLVKQAAG